MLYYSQCKLHCVGLSNDHLKAFGGLVMHVGINCLIASVNIDSRGSLFVLV